MERIRHAPAVGTPVWQAFEDAVALARAEGKIVLLRLSAHLVYLVLPEKSAAWYVADYYRARIEDVLHDPAAHRVESVPHAVTADDIRCPLCSCK